MKRVIYSKEATKALDAMPANIARLIKAKLALYAENSDALGNNVKALQGETARAAPSRRRLADRIQRR